MDDEEDIPPADAVKVFRSTIRKAFADGVITAQEKHELQQLRERLRVPEDIAREIFQEEKAAAALFAGSSSVTTVDSQTTANLSHLAATASAAGNHEEAYNYCNKVLEQDPRNHHAWFGKAKAAGWTSTLGRFRLSEVIAASNRAIELSPQAESEATRTAVSGLILDVVLAFHQLARNHMLEFVSLDQTWPDYLSQCSEMLDGLAIAYTIDPDTRLAHAIIAICTDNVSGVKYVTFEGFNATRTVSPEYEGTLKRLMQKYAEEIRKFDRSFELPRITKATDCFVISAVMDDAAHPAVLELRAFRDNTLRLFWLGNMVIRIYNMIGPSAARLIARYSWLRSLGYFSVVCPALVLVRALSRHSDPCHQEN